METTPYNTETKTRTRGPCSVGRPRVADRNRREPLSVSLPRWQWNELERIAKEHGLTRSSIIADAVSIWLKGGQSS